MKNKKMGILAVLVMLVAVTLNAVGGTYAKYISAYDMTDEARVAKWDFRNEATNTVDLFQSSYTKDGYSYVASSDASKVVAPGTNGEYEYKITGTAETNFMATKTVKVLNRIAIVGDYYYEKTGLGQWGADEGEYEKGKIYYNPISFRIDGGDWVKATEFEYDDNGKFLGLSIEMEVANDVIYPANYNITTELSGKIEWKWDFQTGETTNEQFANDALDTNLARLVDEADLTIQATLGAVVVQTQEEPTVTLEASKAATQRYVAFGNKLPDSYAVKAQKEVGYDPINNEEVVFTGKAMRGTIYKTTNAVADRFNGTTATGYYYPVSFDASAEEGTTVKNLHITATDIDMTVQNGFGMILPISEADKANGINVTVTYTLSDGTEETKDFNLDMSELTFATTTNQSHNNN